MNSFPVEENPFLLFVLVFVFVGVPLIVALIYTALITRVMGSDRQFAPRQIVCCVVGACFFTGVLIWAWCTAKDWSLESLERNPGNAALVKEA